MIIIIRNTAPDVRGYIQFGFPVYYTPGPHSENTHPKLSSSPSEVHTAVCTEEDSMGEARGDRNRLDVTADSYMHRQLSGVIYVQHRRLPLHY